MYQEFSCIQIKVHVARTHVDENFGSVSFSFKTFNQPEKVQLFYTLSWTTHENSEKIGHSVGNLTIFCLIFRDNGKVQLDNL